MFHYAIEWFALAVIILVIGCVIGLSMYRSGKEEGKAEATGKSDADGS